MRVGRAPPFAAPTGSASAALAGAHTPARATAPATLRTCMLPPQETLRLFVTGAAALQGSRSSFGDFREAVPRVSDFFSSVGTLCSLACGTGLYLNTRLICRHEQQRTLAMSSSAHL